jgi:hypothetical protein
MGKGARRYSAAEKGKGCHSNSQRGSTPRRRYPWLTQGLVPLIELPVHLSDRRHATAVQPSQVQLKAKYNQRNRWVGPQSHRFGAPLEHLGLGARARDEPRWDRRFYRLRRKRVRRSLLVPPTPNVREDRLLRTLPHANLRRTTHTSSCICRHTSAACRGPCS